MSLKIVPNTVPPAPHGLSADRLEYGKVYRRANVRADRIPQDNWSLVRCVKLMSGVDAAVGKAVEDLNDGAVVTHNSNLLRGQRFIEVEATLTYTEKN